jgi:hypothetical protein
MAILVGLSACVPRVTLASIPAEVIPQTFKDDVEVFGAHGKPVSNVVWRVFEIKDGRLLAAWTFTQEIALGVKVDEYWIWWSNVDESGAIVPGTRGGGGGGFKPNESFGGVTGSEMSALEGGGLKYCLEASGYCFDGRVKAIQGTTTEGRTAQTTPSGGFWYLPIEDTGAREGWARVSGLDAKGNATVDLQLTPSPRSGVTK